MCFTLLLALFGMMLEPLWGISICRADISVSLNGPGGQASQVIPGVSGSFNVDMPLAKNSQNKITVTAADEHGNTASRDVFITQISYDNLVIAQVKAEPLPPARIEQLVQDGVIQLDNPANFNVSQFTIIMTIDQQPVEVSLPIAVPKEQPEKGGWETYRLPWGADSGGSLPPPPEIQIVVFEESLPGEPGEPAPPPIPGVIIIEGRIKSLKEFFSVRLLLMNISGIFTLADVSAELEFTNGGLSNVLPADGMASFGDIPPGTQTEPVTAEKEFIVRGDEIGTREIKVHFGGKVAGPGIAAGEEIPFNGSAVTSVEVKGPPTFLVQVTHPDTVQAGVPYELLVDITNTGETPALYASLDLDLGGDAEFLNCEIDGGGTPVCSEVPGPLTRPLGNIYPAGKVRQSFTIKPGETGSISSCLGVSDQNITLQVVAGIKGCLVGKYPPEKGTADNAPTVFVLPGANQLGVALTSAVSAFFSKLVNRDTITTGESGSFNVFDKAGTRIPGKLRFDNVNGRTVAVWQVDDGVTNRLSANTEYTVQLTQDIRDGAGYGLAAAWLSKFTTTGEWFDDLLPPVITLSVEPPVNPNAVIPGQRININAYASDQGSGVGRVELRSKDLSVDGSPLQLIDQKNVLKGDLPPYNFAVDSGGLVPGHTYQLQATAYDLMGNAQSSTLAVVLLSSAAPPTITLPAAQDVLHGLSLQLTPVQVTGGVMQVEYFLDSTVQPFDTVKLPPYSTSLPTTGLELDVHTITAIVTDGLGQTGQAVFSFTVRENLNTPTVKINSPVGGAWVVLGQKLSVSGEAADDTGIKSIKWYLDDPAGTPLVSDVTSFLLNTAGAAPGDHTLYLVATNNVDRSSNAFAAASSRAFRVVNEAPSPAPAAPGITSISEPADGTVTVTGTAPSGRRVDVTNTTLGLTLTTYADSSGMFTMTIAGAAGDEISVVVFDPTQTNASAPATGTVNEALVLTSIEVLPPVINFTSLSGSADLAVTAHYADGSTRTVTSQAAFASNDLTVASVNSAGRVVPVKNGSTKVKALLAGKEAAADVNVNVVVPTTLALSPSPISFSASNETAQLVVKGMYSDGSYQALATGLYFVSGNPAVAVVNSTGQVRPVGSGRTQVTVQHGSFAPASVDVEVSLSDDSVPQAAILSPAGGTEVERGQSITVNVKATDLVGGVTRIILETTGAWNYSETKQLVAALETTQQFVLTVPNDAPIGGTLTVSAVARDSGGHSSIPAEIILNVADKTAPAVSITSPAPAAPFNYGDTVAINISANDAVGVAQIRYQATGALSFSGSWVFAPVPGNQTASFSFVVPYGVSSPDAEIRAYARDAAGNERATSVPIILTQADITPPQTRATAASAPGAATANVIGYEVESGLDDLDHVELYFRRNAIGTFNRYTDADRGNAEGKYSPQSGAQGTIAFDSTKMGGDGSYEFYTVGVDKAGNREPAPVDGLGAVIADRIAVFNSGTPVTEINLPTVIGEGDTTYDDKNLLITGATVTISGRHRFKNLELKNGAKISHPETDASTEYFLEITAWTLAIDSSSSIDTDGRGYLGGNRGQGGCSGRTFNNQVGSGSYSAGSYGGLGGRAGSSVINPVYGNLVSPDELGSGGGCGGWSSPGGDGGGRIKLTTINIAVDGTISADGGRGVDHTAADGSGGSINITTSTISGAGAIRANGGARYVGGGGGRIGIWYLDLATFERSRITAAGGQGSEADGANGTVFLKSITETNGTLVVDGLGSDTYTTLPIPPGYVFDNIILRNNARVIADDPLQVAGELRLESGSILSHSVNVTSGLTINARRVSIDATSKIDVSEKGYLGGKRGTTTCSGYTLNGLSGPTKYGGGTYGGMGAAGESGTGLNPVYGDPKEPVHLGTGGGCGGWDSPGGNGGGRVIINAAEEVKVLGSILAVGGTGDDHSAGDGSGGSIKISTSLIRGSGIISARGGDKLNSGGGGRIAVYYDYLGAAGENFSDLRNIVAGGGINASSSRKASSGTVYLKASGQTYGDLYIDGEAAAGATAVQYTPLTHLGFGTIPDPSVSLPQPVSADTFAVNGKVALLPDALAGLEVNPNVIQTRTFKIVSNTANSITVDTGGIDLTGLARSGDTYALVYRYDNVFFRRGGYLVLGDLLVVSDTIRLAENSKMTHHDATVDSASRLELAAGRLVIDAGSVIDVDGRGYLGGNRGQESCSGHGLNFSTDAPRYWGGSYGGLGWRDGSTAATALTYGSLTGPDELGAGGGCGGWDAPGGDGGGLVKINAGEITVDGAISANGLPGADHDAGSGSGGAINIFTHTLNGSGVIRAKGGFLASGGGGGRIAVNYDAMTFAPNQFQVIGGRPASAGSRNFGGNGTLYLKGPGQTFGELIIDGQNSDALDDQSPIPDGYEFDNIVIRNNARVTPAHRLTVHGTLRLENGAVLTHKKASEDGLIINTDVLEIENASIDVSGRGYPGGRTADNSAFAYGITLGGLPGAQRYGGGAYGGLGARITNLPYGSPWAPDYLGSGGAAGGWESPGGYGGGLVQINAVNRVRVNGAIRADGGNAVDHTAGNGSGGSVKITTGLFEGTGFITANGGENPARMALLGGGGGRIAVLYRTLGADNFDGLLNITARGGHPDEKGSAGTVLLKRDDQQFGDLYIDEELSAGTSSLYTPLTTLGFGTIPLPSSTLPEPVTTDTVFVDGKIELPPSGLVGLELNPNTMQTSTFTIVSNTADTITVATDAGLKLTDVAAPGDAYVLVYRFDNVYLRRGAFMVLGDKLEVRDELNIASDCKLTHYSADADWESELNLHLGSLIVAANGAIDVDGRGYVGGKHGVPDCDGRTSGNTEGASRYSAGSYGGLGARTSGATNPLYGLASEPLDLGSGGSCGGWDAAGGDGGGKVVITADDILIDGRITAGGFPGADHTAGSGSGGSVNLRTGTLSGSGIVEANGGGRYLGGGGGRVAVRALSNAFILSNIRANGGTGSTASGQNGTVHID